MNEIKDKAISIKPKLTRLDILKSKFRSFLNKPQGKVIGLVLVFILIVGLVFIGVNQIQKNVAKAALNCPAGSTINGAGTGCTSTTPSGYNCPSGQTLGGNGAQCFVNQQTGTDYSCPSGGPVSGGSCVATAGTPISISPPNCPPSISDGTAAIVYAS